MLPAIFLDRDGVIIENRPDYIRTWADVVIYKQALEALAKISSFPYKIVIITNQSVVGRGLIPLSVATDINHRLLGEIQKAGGRVDGVFMCPHAPEANCNCRKPQPGLLFQAASALSLDLSQSLLIGDTLSDLKAGQVAGVKQTALVKTGLGLHQADVPEASTLTPFPVYNTLADALADLVIYPGSNYLTQQK